MSELICRGVCKKYKEKEALKNVDLVLESGKIYGLIGRNGAGKTTLLSLLSSQNPVSGGEIVYNGKNVWENKEVLKHICFSRELNPTSNNGVGALKIKDYLKTASIYLPDWDQAMADKLIKEFELDVKQKMGKISKGMLSMVTIIVAMASKAEYTFLDEPVAGLDVVMREYFYRLLLEEYTESGRTFVISTHIIEEAASVFEEVIIIKKGELLLKENAQELTSRAFHVSGRTEDVDAATEGLEKHQAESQGRSKGVTVLLKPGQEIREGYDLRIQPLNLQNVFVALCGIGE